MPASGIRSFASADRFIEEVRAGAGGAPLKPGYVLLGDEMFLYERCRKAVLQSLVDPAFRDFALSDIDLGEVSIFEALDRAQTPSLMAPFQVFFLRNIKALYGRGSKKEEFAALDAYSRFPNGQALLLFVADHLHLPSDLRRMDMQDKERYERIRETLGDWCGMVELPRVDEADAVRWLTAAAEDRGAAINPDAARELADALGADMMLIASELEKLLLYTGGPFGAGTGEPSGAGSPAGVSGPYEGQGAHEGVVRRPITLGDVETMVLAAKQRSLYELTDAISAKDRPRALLLLQGLLNASDGGDESAIGHLYMLARTFRQMLVILEKNVRDSRAIWQALWQGFRIPPFAADDLIRQARRYKSRQELARALRLIARADLEVRSSPPEKRLVLERLVLDLASEPRVSLATEQYAMEM